MNLYSLHKNAKELHRYKDADTHVLSLFWDKYKNKPGERQKIENTEALKQREDIIAKSAQHSYEYAVDVIRAPFPKGEKAIATSARYSAKYAENVLDRFIRQNHFRQGEEAISKDAFYSTEYALFVLDAPFPKGEKAIALSANTSKINLARYLKAFPERKDTIDKIKEPQ